MFWFWLFSKFTFFCFIVRLKNKKCDLEKPHKIRIYKENTIVIRTLGVRISMVYSYGCGDGIWTSWPSGYEPDELPDCSTPRYDWCRKPGSNRYEKLISRDFKSRASANSAIPANCDRVVFRIAYIFYHKGRQMSTLFRRIFKKVPFSLDTAPKMWYDIQAEFAPSPYYMRREREVFARHQHN